MLSLLPEVNGRHLVNNNDDSNDTGEHTVWALQGTALSTTYILTHLILTAVL